MRSTPMSRKQKALVLSTWSLVCCAAMVGIRTRAETAVVEAGIREEMILRETVRIVDEAELGTLRLIIDTSRTAAESPAAAVQELSILDLCGTIRSAARRSGIEIDAYSLDTGYNHFSLSGAGDARELLTFVQGIHHTPLSFSISRLHREKRYRIEMVLAREDYSPTQAKYALPEETEEKILSLLGVSFTEAPPAVRAPLPAAQPLFPATLPLGYVGEAVINGQRRVFLKAFDTGRLHTTAREGDYILHSYGPDQIQIEHKGRVYELSKR